MKRAKIDNTDIVILKILHRNARVSLIELSRVTGISITAVRNRLMKLVKHGIIKSFSIDVDYEKLGYTVHALTGIRIEPQHREAIIRALVSNWRVLRLHEVTGDFDLVAEIVARDLSDLREFLTTEMYSIPGIKKTDTMIILRRHEGAGPLGSTKYRRPAGPIEA